MVQNKGELWFYWKKEKKLNYDCFGTLKVITICTSNTHLHLKKHTHLKLIMLMQFSIYIPPVTKKNQSFKCQAPTNQSLSAKHQPTVI